MAVRETLKFNCGSSMLTWCKVFSAAEMTGDYKEIYLNLTPKTFSYLMQERPSMIDEVIIDKIYHAYAATEKGFVRVSVSLVDKKFCRNYLTTDNAGIEEVELTEIMEPLL